VHAALGNNGNILIIRADIIVIAAPEHPGLADAVQTIIVIGAAVAITARQRVVDGERASIQRVAGVGGAGVIVVAGPGRADADSIQARVVHGAGIVITAGCPIRLARA